MLDGVSLDQLRTFIVQPMKEASRRAGDGCESAIGRQSNACESGGPARSQIVRSLQPLTGFDQSGCGASCGGARGRKSDGCFQGPREGPVRWPRARAERRGRRGVPARAPLRRRGGVSSKIPGNAAQTVCGRNADLIKRTMTPNNALDRTDRRLTRFALWLLAAQLDR